MADPEVQVTKEVLYETFYTKAPGKDRLRKTAEGRMKFLVREGWHEVAREQLSPDAIRVRFEREGATRLIQPKRKPPEPRRSRRGEGPGRRG